MNATTKTTTQIRVTRRSAAYWRIAFDNPPLNVMGPQLVREMRDIVTAVEADENVKVIVFDSAVEGFFLNHSDFLADFKELTDMPQGPTGLEAWPLPRVAFSNGSSVTWDSQARLHGRKHGQALLHRTECSNSRQYNAALHSIQTFETLTKIEIPATSRRTPSAPT